MKRAIVAAAASCAAIGGLAFATPAQAQMYWRLDAGWSKGNDANLEDTASNTGGLFIICGDVACSLPSKLQNVGDSYVASGGVGYRWNPNFRGDITLAYRGGYSLDGTDGSGASFKSDITSTALMANAYWDLSASGIRPYVGLGFGWAWNQMDPIVKTFAGGSITTPGGKNSRAAGALMAGLTIPLSGGMVLDVGYRYADLGKIKTDSGTASGVSGGVPFTFPYAGAEGKLTANEITVGVRF
jgi:opacity protein-like surface antigen